MIGTDALEVQDNLNIATKIFRTLGYMRVVNNCDMIFADLHLREGNLLTAKDFLHRSLDASWGKDHITISYCLERLANVGRWTSTSTSWSYKWPTVYLAQAQKIQEKLAVHKALCFLGDVFFSRGDQHTAYSLFVVALEGFTYMDIHRSRADCMLRLGDIEKHRGNSVKAQELWKSAHSLFEQSSQAKDMAQIDTRLASIDQDILDTHQKTYRQPTTLLDELSLAKDKSVLSIEDEDSTLMKKTLLGLDLVGQ
ncbi:hypothetical protein C8R44DRAFT_724968 [Mycena epipterygia]|nr:hypothetical protein C8R44DRAFT_724968 [Mycena epipterygia]